MVGRLEVRKGHRIGVRVTDNNSDWWIAGPDHAGVTVYGGDGHAPVPDLRPDSSRFQGDSGTTRGAYMGATAAPPPADALTGAT